MAGDTDNVKVWSEADVFRGSLTATIPTGNAAFTLNETSGGTADVTTEWDFVGILDGSAGFSESQSNDSSDFNGWGYGVVATAKRNLAITVTFTCLEENLTTLGFRYDTSGLTEASGNLSGTLKGRDLNERFRLAMEVRSGDRIKRRITKNYAQIESVGDSTEGEDGVGTVAITCKVIPDIVAGEPVYWTYYQGAAA